MNDQEHDLDPLASEDDQRVRDLLADLGGERLPPAVSDRLEETLAALVAERSAEQTSQEHRATGVVVPLRPRWLPRAAAAAAAVIVLAGGGVAAANFLGHPTEVATSAGSGAASDKAQSGSESAGGGSGQSSAPPSSVTTTVPAPSAGAERQLAGVAAVPRISSATYATDVRHLLARRPGLRGLARTAPLAPDCPGPADVAGATTRAVLLDGTPAVLVVRPARGDSRAVETWSCAGDRRLATTTVTP